MDITEKKKAGQTQSVKRLRETKEHLQALYDASPDMIFIHDKDGRIIDVSENMLRNYGFDGVGELQDLLPSDLSADGYTDEMAMSYVRLAFEGKNPDFEWMAKRKNGEIFPVEVRLRRLDLRGKNGTGEPGVLAIVRDITERKNAENSLLHYTHSLKKLLDVSQAITLTTNLDKLYRSVVSIARDLLSFDFSTLMILTTNKKQLIIKDTLGFPEAMINTFRLVEGQGLSTYVVQTAIPGTVADFTTESRFEVPPVIVEKGIISALCVPMMFEGDVMGVLIGHTITQRTFTEEDLSLYQNIANQAAVAIQNSLHLSALEESEQKYRKLVESANDSIFIADAETGIIIEANERAGKLLGIPSAEIIGMHQSQLHPPAEMLRDSKRFLEHVKRGRIDGDEFLVYSRSGEIIPVEISSCTMEIGGKKIIQGIFRDIRDRKKMEGELFKAQKLESLGILAGGLAHDFNNLLTVIMGNIGLARMHLDSKGNVVKWLKEAEYATFRARDLTQQLLTFSRGGTPVTDVIAIGPVIEEAARFALRGSSVRCEFSFPSDLWPVEADAGQINQVVNNLLINANQAMPKGGIVSIIGENVVIGEHSTLPLYPGSYVSIAVKDAGIGIENEFLSKIFDPYFTTKQSGSGLGLASAYSIINKHGGHIGVESRTGEGTTFTFYLPAAPGKHAKQQVSESDQITGKGYILIMDDEAPIRAVTTELLKLLGYDAAAVSNGKEAFEAYKKARESGIPFDVVITDLTVPGGMGGQELLKELLVIDPKARVIVSSGYANDPIMSNYREYGFSGVIVKPYKNSELARVINSVLLEGKF